MFEKNASQQYSAVQVMKKRKGRNYVPMCNADGAFTNATVETIADSHLCKHNVQKALCNHAMLVLLLLDTKSAVNVYWMVEWKTI